ncbi:MAG: nicotinate (nicotinamide) nucleotide adenylyltransferase [Candidatus Korobacteraceae bacterium]
MKNPQQNEFQENIALYGGSFDPVHVGHLRVARGAAERFGLARVYFVPADVQPLKSQQRVTNFYHRHAMLALALEGEPRFVPSLLEAPEIVRASGRPASYTVDTVARMRARVQAGTRLFFLIGMDAFALIAKWRSAVELLRSVEFIVASRPGFPLSDVARALPEELRPDEAGARQLLESGSLETNGASIHLLPGVNETVSATEIREAARRGSGLEKLVPHNVAEYILKLKLYDEAEEAGSPEPPRL